MPERFDLNKMLKEIEEDEATDVPNKKKLSQEEIKQMLEQKQKQKKEKVDGKR